jgi:hypothetical protein
MSRSISRCTQTCFCLCICISPQPTSVRGLNLLVHAALSYQLPGASTPCLPYARLQPQQPPQPPPLPPPPPPHPPQQTTHPPHAVGPYSPSNRPPRPCRHLSLSRQPLPLASFFHRDPPPPPPPPPTPTSRKQPASPTSHIRHACNPSQLPDCRGALPPSRCCRLFAL